MSNIVLYTDVVWENGVFLSEKSDDVLKEGAVENSIDEVDTDEDRDSKMAFF